MRHIVESTDGKFIGTSFNERKPIKLGGNPFTPDKKQVFDNGMIQYSNSNYVILTEKK